MPPDPSDRAALLRQLVCPDCGTTFQGTVSATCALGHKPIKLDWWRVCECGHDSHYDMTTFCLTPGCGCDEWTPAEHVRQIIRRTL